MSALPTPPLFGHGTLVTSDKLNMISASIPQDLSTLLDITAPTDGQILSFKAGNPNSTPVIPDSFVWITNNYSSPIFTGTIQLGGGAQKDGSLVPNSSFNYLQVLGGNAGGSPSIRVNGGDTNCGIQFLSANTGPLVFGSTAPTASGITITPGLGTPDPVTNKGYPKISPSGPASSMGLYLTGTGAEFVRTVTPPVGSGGNIVATVEFVTTAITNAITNLSSSGTTTSPLPAGVGNGSFSPFLQFYDIGSGAYTTNGLVQTTSGFFWQTGNMVLIWFSIVITHLPVSGYFAQIIGLPSSITPSTANGAANAGWQLNTLLTNGFYFNADSAPLVSLIVTGANGPVINVNVGPGKAQASVSNFVIPTGQSVVISGCGSYPIDGHI